MVFKELISYSFYFGSVAWKGKDLAFPGLLVEAFPELPVEVTLYDIEIWQLSQSGSQPTLGSCGGLQRTDF